MRIAIITVIVIVVIIAIQTPTKTPPKTLTPGVSEINTSLLTSVIEVVEPEPEVAVEPEPEVAVEPEPEVAVEPEPETKSKSKYLERWFNNRTGQTHWDICQTNNTGRAFIDAFSEFGQDAQVIACVTLNYENGIVGGEYITNAVSPCWSTNARLAQLRQCDYASDNSAGVDAGLFMINTFYQAKRITKLGGPACAFGDSRNASDPCNKLKIAWLHNVDNQIYIIKDIYREQGFDPWVAYLKHVKPYL